MSKVLITGGRGFLGSFLVNDFSLHGDVYTLGFSKKKNDFSVDLSKQFFFPPLFSPEIIIHAAGKAHIIPSNNQEENIFYAVNYEGTKNLCNAIDELLEKPKSFIFVSTVAVYGLESGENICEKTSLMGETSYAKSKIMAEKFLIDWGSKNNIPVLILRLPLVAGVNPPGNLGRMISAINSGKYFSVNNGTARRSIVMASDVARLIRENIGKSGIYNLTDGCHPSFKELEILISTQLNKKQPISIPTYFAKILGKIGDFIPKFPVNTLLVKKMSDNLTFNDEKARKELNWNPLRVVEVFKIK